MNTRFILFFVFIALIACDKKSETEKVVDEIPMKIAVERFDKAFYESPPQDLPKLKKQYPFFFPGTDDTVWLDKMKDPQWRELYTEVEKKFTNFNTEQYDIEQLFKHIKYYFPNTKTPRIITVISEMDYNSKAIYADSLVIVSLELYLGKNHRFYEFPKYLTQNFEPRQIAPDVAKSFAERNIPMTADNTLIGQMVYYGKQLYLKDLLLPEYSDAEKIGFTPDQIVWCEENEGYMWRYFIEEQLLYSSDSKLANRFINPAPFSKFYLEIDNETPGSVGQWVGWQIVRSFMANGDIALNDMLKMDAKTLFEKSKYKPKKLD